MRHFQGNLVLSTELIKLIGRRKELKVWRFERWPFVRAIEIQLRW